MTLVIGYGNPGRGDDGLGPACAERLAAMQLPGVEVLVDFQLKPEHALRLAACRRVIFADAAIAMPDAFRLTPLEPAETGDVTSHAMAPGVLLALARDLVGATPEAHVLAISGADFGQMQDGLSETAERNLGAALAHLAGWLARQDDHAAPVLG